MKAPHYNYAMSAKWTRNYSQDLHTRRLAQISLKSNSKIDSSEPKTRNLLKSLETSYKSSHQERLKQIQQDNYMLVQKLTDPSRKKPKLTPTKFLTLNSTARKLESNRIHKANTALVWRISQTPSLLSKNELLKSYKTSRKYKLLSSRLKQVEETHFTVKRPNK